MDYQEFILRKSHSSNNFGIKPLWIPDSAFDFQKFVAEYFKLKIADLKST